MNEILIQIIVSSILGFLYGFFKKWFVYFTAIALLGLVIMGLVFEPLSTGEALKEGFALWRFGVSILCIILFEPLGEKIKELLDDYLLRRGKK